MRSRLQQGSSVTAYRALIEKHVRNTTAIEDKAKISSRTPRVKAPLDLAQVEIQSLKHKLTKRRKK